MSLSCVCHLYDACCWCWCCIESADDVRGGVSWRNDVTATSLDQGAGSGFDLLDNCSHQADRSWAQSADIRVSSRHRDAFSSVDIKTSSSSSSNNNKILLLINNIVCFPFTPIAAIFLDDWNMSVRCPVENYYFGNRESKLGCWIKSQLSWLLNQISSAAAVASNNNGRPTLANTYTKWGYSHNYLLFVL